MKGRCFLCYVIIIVLLLTGCGEAASVSPAPDDGGTTAESPTVTAAEVTLAPLPTAAAELPPLPAADTLAFTEVTHYASYPRTVKGWGGPEPGWEAVEQALNEVLEPLLRMHYRRVLPDTGVTPLEDYTARISAGENLDLVGGKGDLSFFYDVYQPVLREDGWLPLEKLLPEVAPAVWGGTSADAWEQVTLGGHIVCIPGYDGSYPQGGLLIRKDWAENVGFAEISGFTQLEQYLLSVQQERLSTSGYAIGYCWDETALLREYLGENTSLLTFNTVSLSDLMGRSPEEWWVLEDIWQTREARDFLVRMKDWREQGLWDTDSIASGTDTAGRLLTGGVALYCDGGAYTRKPGAGVVSLSPNRMEEGEIALSYMGNRRRVGSDTASCLLAIPKNALNPERALLFLDVLERDAAACRLIKYGLPDVNYTLTEEGRQTVAGADGFLSPFYNSDFAAGNDLPAAGEWTERGAWIASQRNRIFANPYSFFDISGALSEQKDALYDLGDLKRGNSTFRGLLYGLYDDPLTVLESYLSEREAAGFTAVTRTLQQALEDYHAQQGG